MSFHETAPDVVVRVASDNSIAPERRISPSWSIAQLKSKLELVTGVPPSNQLLTLRLPHNPDPIVIEGPDEESIHVSDFPLQPYSELHVCRENLFLSSTTSRHSLSHYKLRGRLFYSYFCKDLFYFTRLPCIEPPMYYELLIPYGFPFWVMTLMS